MFLFILGLICAFVGRSVLRSSPTMAHYSSYAFAIGLLIASLGIFSKVFVIIQPGTVGVQTLFGKVQSDVLESGLRIMNPFMDVTTFDIRTQNYTMSGVHDEGKKTGDDAIRALTADGLEVVMDLSVLYRVVPTEAPKILSTIGTDFENVVIRPVTRTRIRDNTVYYDAVSLYSTKREEFQSQIFKSIEKDFKDRGLFLEQLLVRNITLPQSVRTTIESKINAEQEAQKMQFVLQKEKQEAERKRMEAQGIADYQRIINTGLSNNQLQYEQIKAYKEIATSPNTKVIIMSGGKGNPVIIGNQ